VDIEAHTPKIAKALSKLETSLERLIEALAHRPVVGIVEGTSTQSAVRLSCEAYSAIDYEMEDDIGDSVVLLGVLGVPAEVLKLGAAVNDAKTDLKTLFAPLQRVRVRIPVKGGNTKAIAALRVILRNIQRSDLNVHAAYRKIPILRSPPKSVTYTRAHTRSVYRKTVDEIAGMLSNIHSTAASADLERLSSLDRHVTHLALVRYRYQNIRANVLYSRLDSSGRGRIQISAELPLLYATGRRSEPPEVQFPTADDSKPKRTRESKIEPEPFLRSLPVHRYQRKP
jgi:hypothetical protein